MSVVNRTQYNLKLRDGSSAVIEAETHIISHGTVQFYNREHGHLVLVVAYGQGAWQSVEQVNARDVQDMRTLGRIP